MTLATRLSQAKQASGLSLYKLADRSGYSRSHLEYLASGTRSNPTIACVEAIAGALGVSPAWLAFGDEK